MRDILPLAIGALLAWGGQALAVPAPGGPPAERLAAAHRGATIAPARAQLSDADLAALTGGDNVTVSLLNRQQLTGTTTGNTLTTDTLNTGSITFGQQALGNYAGVGNFVVNTGANNVLQGAITINIITPPGAP